MGLIHFLVTFFDLKEQSMGCHYGFNNLGVTSIRGSLIMSQQSAAQSFRLRGDLQGKARRQ